MSEKIKNGGPAFPCEFVKHKSGDVGNNVPIMAQGEGLTMRDYFAAKALAGIISNATAKLGTGCEATNSAFAQVAYMLADAMLEERDK